MTAKKPVWLAIVLSLTLLLVGCGSAESPTAPNPIGATGIKLSGEAEDLTAPSFVSLSIAPVAIDTSAGPQDVTVSVGMSDDPSGVARFTMYFTSPSGAQSVNLICFVGNPGCLVTGDPTSGTFELTLTFPQFIEQGTWNARIDDVRDNAGNITAFSTTFMQGAGFSTALEVTSEEDVETPTFVSLSFDPVAIDTSASSQEVTVTVGASDALAGVARFTMFFSSPTGGQSVDRICRVGNPDCPTLTGDANDGTFRLILTFPQFSEDGAWNARIGDVRDNAGNTTAFSTTLIQAAGFDTELTVGSVADVTPPEFVGLAFAPDAIDGTAGPQEVTVDVSLRDSPAGVARFTVFFDSPTAGQSVDIICFVGRPGCPITSGDAQDGSFQVTLTFPQFSEIGVWRARVCDVRDAAFNITCFSSEFIEGRGFNAELTVTGLDVAIDIKPGSFPNSINTRSRGRIPVAILSSPGFDAPAEIDRDSLRFGRTGDESSLSHCGDGEDVNGDQLADLVCHFFTQLTGFQSGDTEGILRGETVGGNPIEAADSVRIVR